MVVKHGAALGRKCVPGSSLGERQVMHEGQSGEFLPERVTPSARRGDRPGDLAVQPAEPIVAGDPAGLGEQPNGAVIQRVSF